jgi:TBC1 domain family member 5
VTGNLQKRTEGWDVSRAVRSAVGEVRRNMNNYQSAHSRQSSVDSSQRVVPVRTKIEIKPEALVDDARQKLQQLQERNTVLAKMLDDALQSLRTIKMTTVEGSGEMQENFNICLAKIQFVSVYLSDSDIPIPTQDTTGPSSKPADEEPKSASTSKPLIEKPVLVVNAADGAQSASQSLQTKSDFSGEGKEKDASKTTHRPSLMDASFSFMLGEDRRRSSFVSSVADLPEQNRDSSSKGTPKQKATEGKLAQERKGSESEGDGFSLTNIKGGQG